MKAISMTNEGDDDCNQLFTIIISRTAKISDLFNGGRLPNANQGQDKITTSQEQLHRKRATTKRITPRNKNSRIIYAATFVSRAHSHSRTHTVASNNTVRGDASDPPHYSASSQAHHKAPPIATIATQMGRPTLRGVLCPNCANCGLWIVRCAVVRCADDDVNNLFADA